MGAGIAQIFALAGYDVKVFEPSAEVRGSLHERTRKNLEALGDDVRALERIKCYDNLHDAPHEFLIDKVKKGQLGFKTGEGFQSWTPEAMEATRNRLLQHLKASRA